jgi:hypothetical protein
VRLESLTVSDPANPTNAAADGGTLYVEEGADHTATIDISGVVSPDTSFYRAHTLWRIDEYYASPSQGNFSSSSNNVTLTVVDNNRTWHVKAGVDANGNGNLDAGEVTKTVQVQLEKFTNLSIADDNAPANQATSTTNTPIDWYVGEQTGGTASVNVAALTLPGTSAALANIVWKVSGNNAAPTSGNFGGGDQHVTLTPTGGNRDFVVEAGFDDDKDGQLDEGEGTRTINVHVVKLQSLSVADDNNPANMLTNDTTTAMDWYVAGLDPDGHAAVNVSALVAPGTSAAMAHVLWKITGNTAASASGNFGGGDQHVTLTPTGGNYDFGVKAGFDLNADGTLSDTEVTRTINVHVVYLKELKVADDNAPANKAAASTTTAVDWYVAGLDSDGHAAVNVAALIEPTTSKARVFWSLSGNAATPTSGNFGGDNHVTLTPTGGNRDFILTAGIDANGNTTLDSAEVTRTINIHVVKINLAANKIDHNAASGELPENQEESVGAFLPVNNDDDDYDAANTADMLQTGAIAGESDLLPVTLTAVPGSAPGKYKLLIPSHLKVWENSDRTGQITASTELTPGAAGKTVYVEGVSAGSGLLKVDWIVNGATYAAIDQVRVTAFTWTGPLNVPGHSIYRYTASGALAGSKWINPIVGGTLVTPPAAAAGDIRWNGGPIVGKASYQVNDDYVWDLEVNVVQVALGTTNSLTYNNPPSQNGATTQIVSNVPGPAMEAELDVEINGPVVGGSVRGVKFIEAGLTQTLIVTKWHADYNALPKAAGGGALGRRRTSNMEGQAYLDGITAAPSTTVPWYDSND